MSTALRGTSIAICFLSCVHALAQTKPTINVGVTEGQVTVTGTAQDISAQYLTVNIQLCMADSRPTIPVPTTCMGPGFAVLNGVGVAAAGGVFPAAGGVFSAVLANSLPSNKWIYALQTTTGTVSTLASDAVQVAAIKVPSITTSVTPPVNAISGTGQAPNSVYTTVKIFVCYSSDKNSVGTNCQLAPLKPALIDLPAAATSQFALVNSQGSFAANLDAPISVGQYIWLWQVVTTAGGVDLPIPSSGGIAADQPIMPTITLPLKDGGTAVLGTAMKSAPSGDKVTVQLCTTMLANVPCTLKGSTTDVGQDGTFTIPHILREGEIIVVHQQSTNPATPIPPGYPDSESATVGVPDNERVYADFIGGVLLSQSQQAFSQANIYMAVNIDDAFYRPGWYSQFVNACEAVPVKDSEGHDTKVKKVVRRAGITDGIQCKPTHHPGLNGFFQVRLTAIPVNSTQTTTTTTSSASSSSYDTFLVSRKTAHFEMGLYVPTYFGRTHLPTSALRQAFFVAPIVRFGFNTLVADDSGTGSSTSTTPTGGVSTVTSTVPIGATDPNSKVYSFGVAGVRIGTADLKNGSAHTAQYLDLGVGKFSNLTNLYCSSKSTDNCLSGGSVGQPTILGTLDPTKESHYTPYRFLIEGAMDIDGFIIGFSVNKGQNWTGFHRPADATDHITPAQDDVRFLFGYKVDINKLLTAVRNKANF